MSLYATLPTPDEGCGRESRGELGKPCKRPPKVKGSQQRELRRAESLRQKDREPEGVLESPIAMRPAPTG